MSWLTNSALVYEPICGERGEGVVESQQMSTALHRSPNKPMLCSVEQELCTFVQYSTVGAESLCRCR
jgi:hypothetical protein